ncbi:MAG: class I SAM-dependent methyltransferase [Ferruginibacter sp.]
MSSEDYLQKNKDAWNKKTALHLQSAFYDQPGFLKGRSSLNKIELDLLGDVKGKTILHLQCHFGQDSISLARLGAQVTGVDFSDAAIATASLTALQTGVEAKFICSDIYDLSSVLNGQFDIVFTSYGTIGWLPDMDKWAAVVGHFLKPGGVFVFVEFHPVVWMFDNDFKKISYDYFKADPIIEIENGTYADKEATITTETVSWNHSISEVVKSLLSQNLRIMAIDEYDYSPYSCFNNVIEQEPGKFRIAHLENKIPMVYAIKAFKENQ